VERPLSLSRARIRVASPPVRLLKKLLVALAILVLVPLALLALVGALVAVGAVKLPAPNGAPPSVQLSAQPPLTPPTPPSKPLAERPCTLRTDGVKHIALFPDAASAQAFHEVVMAADGLRMLDAPGVFEVIIGTRCTLLDLGSAVSKVHISEGEHVGAEGFITTEWVVVN